MFYYREKIPVAGTIVVVMITEEKENETCVYVILPEYNNSVGIIYKSELPKRLKAQRKTIAEMKQAGQIVCVVSNTPKLTQDGNLELVELSVKGVDQKWHTDVITRYKNIEK